MKPEDQAFPSFGVIHWNKEKQQFEAFNPMPGMSKRLYIATQLATSVGHIFAQDTLSDSERDRKIRRLIFAADQLIAEDAKR